jgi:hypothetical protein
VLLRRHLASDVAVIAAGLLIVGSAVVLGTVASALGLNLIAVPWLLGLVYACLVTVTAGLAWRRAGWAGPGGCRSTQPVAFLPAAVAAATAVFQSFNVSAVQSWAFFGTDVLGHMSILAPVQQVGQLDYSASAYPRAIHMLAALSAVPGAPVDDTSTLLTYDLRLVGALAWLSLAFMLWAGVVLCLQLGPAVRLSRHAACCAAGLFGGAGLLTNTFLESFVRQGAAPSLVAMAVLFALAIVALELPRQALDLPAMAAATAMASMLLSHLWQALAIAPVFAFAAHALYLVRRDGWSAMRPPVRRALSAGATVAVAALLAYGPLFSVVDAGGARIAASAGELSGEPWPLLVTGLLSALGLLRWAGTPWAAAFAGTAAGLTATVAYLVIGAGGDLSALSQWYPQKACWFLTVFLSPWLAVTVVRHSSRLVLPVWVKLARLPRGSFVVRSGLLAAVAAAASVTWLPWQLGVSASLERAWNRYDATAPGAAALPLHHGGALDLVQRHGENIPPAVAVPWRLEESSLFEAGSLRVVSDLLHFTNGQPRLMTMTDDVCERIQELSDGRPAVVLTRAPAREVRQELAEGGCPGARVVNASLDR